MTRYGFLNHRKSLIFKSFIVFSLFFYASALSAQSPVNLSGVWIQDTVKSDDFYKAFNVKCTITQTPQSIRITQTFFDKSGKEITSHDNFFNLDVKETSIKEQGDKKSAIWSPDKKILTTTDIKTYGSEVVGSTATYSLSDNGLVLTIHTSDINPGGLSIVQVFNKKQ